MRLTTLLNEHYVNAVTKKEKEQYAQDVWDMLQAAYKQIGGIHGSGFESTDDMVDKIPFWKMVRRNGKIIAVQMYKDSGGRKMVAMASDGTREGKEELAKILKHDFERSYGEVSDAAEKFVMKHFPEAFKTFRIPATVAGRILGKEVVPSKDGYHYTREIGGQHHEKIMLGTPGKKLVFYEF